MGAGAGRTGMGQVVVAHRLVDNSQQRSERRGPGLSYACQVPSVGAVTTLGRSRGPPRWCHRRPVVSWSFLCGGGEEGRKETGVKHSQLVALSGQRRLPAFVPPPPRLASWQ